MRLMVPHKAACEGAECCLLQEGLRGLFKLMM